MLSASLDVFALNVLYQTRGLFPSNIISTVARVEVAR